VSRSGARVYLEIAQADITSRGLLTAILTGNSRGWRLSRGRVSRREVAREFPRSVSHGEGYDKKAFAEEVESRGAEAVIPTQKGRKEQRAIDRHLYRERNVCERFWSKVKQYRRVATRYEKKAANFLAFVKVAAIMIMLK
jgi:hypothetical protein